MKRVPPTHNDDSRPQAWMSDLRSADPGSRFDPSVPHPARVYSYWLGGKDTIQPTVMLRKKSYATAPRSWRPSGRTGRF